MKIAFVLPSLENRGPAIFTKYLIDALVPLVDGIEVFYFNEYPQNQCIMFKVPCNKISFWGKLNFSSFDIVHSTMAIPDIYCSLKVPKRKWVVAMHNFPIDQIMLRGKIKGTIINICWKIALKKCCNVILSSTSMLNFYKKYLGYKNFQVIPYGIPNIPYESIKGNEIDNILKLKKNGYFILGSVGMLVYRKGFHQLIEVLQRNSNIALLLIGDGNERNKLMSRAVEYGISDRLIMPGFRTNSFNYYQFIDAYAHVSYSEGFGLAMLEALAKNKPIICSRLEIYNDYFSEEDVAFFTPNDIQELDAAINKIRNNVETYSKKSKTIYEHYFTDTVMAEKHIGYYMNLLLQ
jgi:glycosyltransferase involved in cell wall biosynthesis